MKSMLLRVGDDTILVQTENGTTVVRSSMRSEEASSKYNAAIEALEAIVHGHVSAGIRVEDPQYIAGLESALQDITIKLY
jgi:hypothetical protein